MKRSARVAFAVLLAGVVVALGVTQAVGLVGELHRVSLTDGDVQATGDSSYPDASADGRYVTFSSYATDLVAGDVNGSINVFVRDTVSGTTSMVDVTAAGTPHPAAFGFDASISDDGRYIAFVSSGRLTSDDTNNSYDVYLRDRVAGTTTMVSKSVNSGADGHSSSPTISGNGQFVVFASESANLVANDTNGKRDIFAWDRTGGGMERVSVTSAGAQAVAGFGANGDAPGVSYDGRYVVFGSEQSDLTGDDGDSTADIFLRDRQLGSTVRLTGGMGGEDADLNSMQPVISGNGRYLAFMSYATNLVPNDTNSKADIFFMDVTAPSSLERISIGPAGAQADRDPGGRLGITQDGHFVVFCSWATNLLAGDTNDKYDIFVRDTQADTTSRISVSATGAQADGGSFEPAITPDGMFALFESQATNLISGDTNNKADILVRQMIAKTPSATALTASASTTKPAYGAAVTIAGVLHATDVNGAPIAEQPVSLQRLSGGVWTERGQSAATGGTGAVSFSITTADAATYRLHFAGSSELWVAADSPPVTITPKVVLGTPKAPKTMKKNKYYTVYGSLKPKHSSGTVRVYKEKRVKVKGKWTWKKYGYVKAKVKAVSATSSKYSVKMRLTSKGTWRLKAYMAADSKHSATYSAKYDTVSVK